MKAFVKTTRAPGGELREVPEPRPGPGEVLVGLRAASICGTDLHIWDWNEWAQKRLQKIPLILGHELSGEVLELGAGVRGLAVGDNVSAETHIADGTCYQCRTGRMHICENVRVLGVDTNGVFAEYAVIPEINAWKNDPNLEPSLASVQEPLGNAVHCLLPEDNVEDLAGKNVLITGCGPIGLVAILVARALGAASVIATEVNPTRLELAHTMGADSVLNPKDLGARTAAEIRTLTGGAGADIALEMSGHPDSFRLAFDALRPGGRVSLLGLFDRDVSLNVDDAIIFKAARVHGIFGRRMFDTWYTVKGLLAKPRFREDMRKIITHRFPIGELPQAMDVLHSGAAAKVSLEPRW